MARNCEEKRDKMAMRYDKRKRAKKVGQLKEVIMLTINSRDVDDYRRR
jgi:hypothetical protein